MKGNWQAWKMSMNRKREPLNPTRIFHISQQIFIGIGLPALFLIIGGVSDD